MTAEEAHLSHLRLKGHTATSVYARKRALARLTAALAVPLLSATPADLAEWRAGLTVGDQAVVAYVSHAKKFFDFCVDEGLMDINPAASLPVPRLGRRIPRPIGEDDLMEALAVAPGRIRLMIVLAGWGGLRARELALLRRECILETLAPPVLLVKALLGHASVASTEGYALYDNTAAAAVVGAIPAPARLRVAQ